MAYTLSYSGIHDLEVSKVGARALFLSKASAKGLNVPIFFVVTSDAFEKFFEYNSLSEKINELLKYHSEDEFWSSLKEVFSSCSFPDDVKNEVRESYESVSISGSAANNILRSFDARVNVFVSSNNSGLDDIFLNIKGFDNVLSGIKSCWFLNLKRLGLNSLKDGTFFDFGVVVEKFVSSDFSVEVETSFDEKNLLLSFYKGLPEVSSGIVKDNYVLSFNHLEFISYELNSQNFSILHQEDSGVLLKKRLGREGSDNKASKQLVSECARLAKRVFGIVGNSVKVIFIVKSDVPYLFLVDNFNERQEVVSSEASVVSEISGVESSEDDLSEGVSSSEALPEDVIESAIPSDDITSQDAESDLVDSSNKDFGDSDEFIVQDSPQENVGSDKVEDSLFSSFFKWVELLEEDLLRMYKESFGFNPSNLEEAVYELDSKHGFSARDKILRVLEVKSLLIQGEEVDEDIVSSLIGVMENFLQRDGE